MHLMKTYKYHMIRSHAQKYFLKVQKGGTGEHLPPPRPKRKAAHPYPQKASKIVISPDMSSFQASPAVPDAGYVRRPESSTLFRHSDDPVSVAAWTDKSMPNHGGMSLPNIYSCGSNDSTPKTRPTVLPDFAQVYGFIGSVFDPKTTGHLSQLKKMAPIDIETVLLLMRNLSINLASPNFEDHKQLLSSYEADPEESAFDVTDTISGSQSEDAA